MELSPFFNPYGDLAIHTRNLPHWQQTGVWTFLTWRLVDALPIDQLQSWRREQLLWLSKHPQPWDEEVAAAYRRLFPTRLERWLDEGKGECWLRHPEAGKVVAEGLRYFDGARYDLGTFVVMPNHVHVLVRLGVDEQLGQIVKAWKSWTAREINRVIGHVGTVWQEGYWDRLVRDEQHLHRCERYIEDNPRKAGLGAGEFVLWGTGRTDGDHRGRGTGVRSP